MKLWNKLHLHISISHVYSLAFRSDWILTVIYLCCFTLFALILFALNLLFYITVLVFWFFRCAALWSTAFVLYVLINKFDMTVHSMKEWMNEGVLLDSGYVLDCRSVFLGSAEAWMGNWISCIDKNTIPLFPGITGYWDLKQMCDCWHLIKDEFSLSRELIWIWIYAIFTLGFSALLLTIV